MTEPRLVAVADAHLEVVDQGSGEPVLFIQTAMTADELAPLAHLVADGGYRCLVYHRRGYAGSSPLEGRGSIPRDAVDCAGLLDALEIERAHVVGFSYSAAVGLQLAASHSSCVHTLSLIEPPPVHTASAPEFRAANDELIEARRERGPNAAVDEFLTRVIGPVWRQDVDTSLPGAAAQIEADTATFLDSDLPALLDWAFDVDDARSITCPVVHVGGTASGPWFAEVRELILEWLPHAEDVLIEGADHSLTLTHTSEIAEAVLGFIRRHPVSRTGR